MLEGLSNCPGIHEPGIVNYLLQRMEDYRGLAILCTNRRSALDRAFLRRLRFAFLAERPANQALVIDHQNLLDGH